LSRWGKKEDGEKIKRTVPFNSAPQNSPRFCGPTTFKEAEKALEEMVRRFGAGSE